ncbi:MAG: hypothetical protein A2X66_04955 [Ignavibacteria bacterium GWA2_54_16]|nr:MAG: hypothetical protein A2X66_04955 [Ignavibacteria bacterium GWA2_54_16]
MPPTERNHGRGILLHRSFGILLLATLLTLPLLAEPQDSSQTFVLFPRPLPSGTFNSSLGISMTIIPRAIVQEGVLPLPMVDVRMRYGLTDHLFLSGQANLVYVTNQVSLGLGWSHSFGRLSFALEDKVGYWLGFAGFEGFDATAMGLTHYPSVTVGVAADNLYLSFRTEALFTISQHTYFGTASVGRINPKLAGFAFTLAAEQALWKDNYFMFGTRIQYALPMYQTWLAFSAFDRWLVFPEVFIGYEL